MYANIIIDISQEKLDRTFQYRIPEHLTDAVQPGVLVEIPFGRGKRLIRGYVVEVTKKPEFDVERIKDIASVVTKSIPIEAQLIALAAWMKEHFGGTMYQALKTVLPVKEKTAKKEHRFVHLVPERIEAKNLLAQLEKKQDRKSVV